MKRIAITLLLGALCASNALARNANEAPSLLFLKQEEKLARDVYLTLGELWGHATFLNIAQSEQRHMDAVDRLMTYYGLTDTTPTGLGEFTIPELQELHDNLIATGVQSLEDALGVGVVIEVTDIDDIEEMLGATEDPMLLRLLTNLQNGSYRHLEAFTRALEQPDEATCTGDGSGRQNRRGGQVGNGGARDGSCIQAGQGRQGGGRGPQSGKGRRQGGLGQRDGSCLGQQDGTCPRTEVGSGTGSQAQQGGRNARQRGQANEATPQRQRRSR
jgi:hypothetical protein